VEYTPSEYKDLVIDVKYGGRSISPGFRLPEGSYVTLVVGSGLGDEDIMVPALKGMNLEDARQEAITSSLVIGAMDFDVAPRNNESSYIIYGQRPAAGKLVPAGTRIDIWLSKDKTMLDKPFEGENEDAKSEEEFF
jgi:beta-lactam-binding protein with PASTA domain